MGLIADEAWQINELDVTIETVHNLTGKCRKINRSSMTKTGTVVGDRNSSRGQKQSNIGAPKEGERWTKTTV